MALWRTRRVGASALIKVPRAETRVKRAVWSILLSTVLSLSKEKYGCGAFRIFLEFRLQNHGVAVPIYEISSQSQLRGLLSRKRVRKQPKKSVSISIRFSCDPRGLVRVHSTDTNQHESPSVTICKDGSGSNPEVPRAGSQWAASASGKCEGYALLKGEG